MRKIDHSPAKEQSNTAPSEQQSHRSETIIMSLRSGSRSSNPAVASLRLAIVGACFGWFFQKVFKSELLPYGSAQKIAPEHRASFASVDYSNDSMQLKRKDLAIIMCFCVCVPAKFICFKPFFTIKMESYPRFTSGSKKEKISCLLDRKLSSLTKRGRCIRFLESPN